MPQRTLAGVAYAITGSLVLTLSAGCVGYRHASETRLASPDGRVEMVILNHDANAVDLWEYRIYIVAAGQPVRNYPRCLGGDEPVLTGTILASDFMYGWTAPRRLDLGYYESRIHSFRSTWTSRQVDAAKYLVEIRLRWYDPSEGRHGRRRRPTPG